MASVRLAASGPFISVGGGSVAPLSAALFVDPGTTVAPADQTGSIGAPFSFIQQALDAFRAAGVTAGTVLCCPGDYGGFTVDWNDPDGERLTLCALGLGQVFNVGQITSELEDGILVLQGLGTGTFPVLAVTLTDTALEVVDCVISQIVAADSSLRLEGSRFLSDGVQGASIQATDCQFEGTLSCPSGDVVARGTSFGSALLAATLDATDCSIDVFLQIASSGAVVARDCVVRTAVSHGSWQAWDCSFLGALSVETFTGNGCVFNAALDSDQLSGADGVFLYGGACNMPITSDGSVELYGTVMGLLGETESTVTGSAGIIRGGVLSGSVTFTNELQIDSVTNQALLNAGGTVTASPVVIVDDP